MLRRRPQAREHRAGHGVTQAGKAHQYLHFASVVQSAAVGERNTNQQSSEGCRAREEKAVEGELPVEVVYA